jgi:hypothetical protein
LILVALRYVDPINTIKGRVQYSPGKYCTGRGFENKLERRDGGGGGGDDQAVEIGVSLLENHLPN